MEDSENEGLKGEVGVPVAWDEDRSRGRFTGFSVCGVGWGSGGVSGKVFSFVGGGIGMVFFFPGHCGFLVGVWRKKCGFGIDVDYMERRHGWVVWGGYISFCFSLREFFCIKRVF